MRAYSKKVLGFIDILTIPLAAIAALLMRWIHRLGLERLPHCLGLFRKLGVYPLRDHYYEPLFQGNRLKKSLREDRTLPAIDWNIEEQLKLLDAFHFNDELLGVPIKPTNKTEFFFDNHSFASGDAEFLYNMIRHFQPEKIIEIGSGYSTLMAGLAVKKNLAQGKVCHHTCIEPYEMPWLESTGVTVIRKPVEELPKSLFLELGQNDILFIDSSHMIRPQGDVLFEYLEILPALKSGVLIHVHDIFSPKDYLDEWIRDKACFWNEQYLLEAFLSYNPKFKIIGSLNFLRHHYPQRLAAKCPFLAKQLETREPGSFWLRKV